MESHRSIVQPSTTEPVTHLNPREPLAKPHAVQAVVLLLLVGIAASGCVRRRLTVRTSPPGAMVFVDRQPLGVTPVSHSFTYYGTRHFEIVKDGYRTETFLRNFNAPWYQFPPLDFFAENLWPFEKRDERIVDVQLIPDPVVPTDALVASAEGLRTQARQGLAVVTPTPVPPGTPPSYGYPTPSLNERYIDPTLPGNGVATPVLPTVPNPSSSPVLPNADRGGLYLPELLQPPPSIPALNITPGNSYRPNSDSLPEPKN